jgi:peptidoglycan/xylan/chitin deacetylase (PgdA/CDA1 family)
MRLALKQMAERLLGSRVALRLGKQRRRRQGLVLAYHNVVPAGTSGGDRSLHLDFDRFRRQMDSLERGPRVLGLEDGAGSTEGEPVVVITFDDAYAGAVTLALPELAARGLPATLFVAPGLLDRGAPWWDRLAVDGAVPEHLRTRCLEELGGETARIDAQIPARLSGGPAALAIATREQLHQVAGLRGLTLGAHSWSHPNLCTQNDRTLREELTLPLAWLKETFPEQSRPWIAYPYGYSNPEVRRAAKECGYEAGFAVTGGWSTRADDPLVLPRLNIPAGLSDEGFRARLAGWLS